MKRIDFYLMKKRLHLEQLGAISYLFEHYGFSEIDLMPQGEPSTPCYVIISKDGAQSTEEVKISKVKYSDGIVSIRPFGEDDWISCEFAGDVVPATLDDLYNAVYDFIADLNHVYYVCQLDANGKPTGKVTKETWKLEYADKMMEQRGFIYNNYQTALLHAQYGK